MRRRRELTQEELDELIIDGQVIQPVMVDYNTINMYMNRTPVGDMGCAANILLLLAAGGLCMGITYGYAWFLSLFR
jgi:hypothetical protein